MPKAAVREEREMAKEPKETTITTENKDGFVSEVKIADDVVATIAGLAATEVEGVASMAGNMTNELVGKLGYKNSSKGVKISVIDDHVTVDLSLNMKYGYSIPKISATVQDKVRDAIENMTGLIVDEVNIKIAGVEAPAEA
jgi:uncharacterized alkaline shock family protein YloU